jgi:hypothetical protein
MSHEVYDLLRNAEYDAHPSWRRLATTHWVMSPEWYMTVRRAFLPPPDDDEDEAAREARDESKWVPDPGDMVLGYTITVTGDGGAPHLADGRPDAEFRQRLTVQMEPFYEALSRAELADDAG